jgi:hypothetical protein
MPHEDPDQSMTEQQIRVELGEVLDERGRLPPDASIAERSRLKDRETELARMLREIEIPGAEEIKAGWSETASKQAEDDKPFVEIHLPDSSGGGFA